MLTRILIAITLPVWQCVGITAIPHHREKATVGVGKYLLALLLRELLLEPAHRPESHFLIHTILSPISDAINVKIKNRRQKLAGSLNTRVPMSAVPMAPMPVHTGQAVPIGMVFAAFASSNMLNADTTTNPEYLPPIRC